MQEKLQELMQRALQEPDFRQECLDDFEAVLKREGINPQIILAAMEADPEIYEEPGTPSLH